MTIHEATIAKIQEMPEELVQEVQDYIDYLLIKRNSVRWQAIQRTSEVQILTESDMADYLPNLEDYEEKLVRGEIKW